MRASVVTGVATALVFEPSEHVLDFVALTVESAILVDFDFAIGFGRDAGRYASF